MALLDRVATLVRANLNDLLDKAENPEKMLKQVILDMENQFMQVKTQVAIALADLHLLEKKKTENAQKWADWMRKAELALEKKDEELARAALTRATSFKRLRESFDQQIADQEQEVEALKSALKSLDAKLTEARTRTDLLIVQHRRSRAARRAAEQQSVNGDEHAMERMRSKIAREQALAGAASDVLDGDVGARLDALEREQEIDALLEELKAKKGLSA